MICKLITGLDFFYPCMDKGVTGTYLLVRAAMLSIQPSHGEVIRTGMLLQFIISLFHQFNPLAPLLNVALSAQTTSIRFMKLTCCFTTLLFFSNMKLRIFSQLDFFFKSVTKKTNKK